ncbi:MAG TPA: Tex family protein [Aquella sp.]|nr:Tex family protein [Aquella sp.]
MLLPIHIRLAKLLNIKENQIQSTITLLDDGATVPFIARYRKEITGGLDDIQLRDLVEKLTYMRELDDRRETILNSIKEQDKLTPELEAQILAADNKTTLEDLYLPYKPKRRTRAQIAREAGLEPLALDLLNHQELDPETEALKYINPEHSINDIKNALDGARYILIELFAESADVLAEIRALLNKEAVLTTKVIEGQETDGQKFTDYFAYSESIRTIPSHRALAAFRGSNEGILSISIDYPGKDDTPRGELNRYEQIIVKLFNLDPHAGAGKWLIDTAKLCFKAKIFLSMENELLANIREYADDEAIRVFATNLNNLLLTAPAGSKTTIGLDPGIRTGVKVAVVDQTSKVLETTTIYPFQPQNRYTEAVAIIAKLAKKYHADLISIGNGTASRETEKLVRDMLKIHTTHTIIPVIVSEAGASVYSASEYASKEFPNMDVSLRGAVSIARRLQDPLAELVKIDPKSIGVGQYQHDVNQNKLAGTLGNVVEDCVNKVGVDVNTASIPLLASVSGLNNIIAGNIVSYRDSNGMFKSRNELKKVPRLGEKTFEQCAGFLRIHESKNPLDNSAVHPESYPLVDLIAQKLDVKVTDLIANHNLLKQIKPTEFVSDTYGLPTINDVLAELEKPGRDPRGEFKTATFKEGVDEINDLKIGMELEGIVTNVTNFGAFVDIGVHQDGLVHISEIANHYVSNPADVLKAGQIVKVRVIDVDAKRKRIALSMKSEQRAVPAVGGKKPPKASSNPASAGGTMADALARLKCN